MSSAAGQHINHAARGKSWNQLRDLLFYCHGNCSPRGQIGLDLVSLLLILLTCRFTEFQKHSVNFKDVPFELWEIKRYENNLFGLIQHKTTSSESISIISEDKSNVVNQVSKQIKVYIPTSGPVLDFVANNTHPAKSLDVVTISDM